MMKVIFCIVCILLCSSLCFAEMHYPISENTNNRINELINVGSKLKDGLIVKMQQPPKNTPEGITEETFTNIWFDEIVDIEHFLYSIWYMVSIEHSHQEDDKVNEKAIGWIKEYINVQRDVLEKDFMQRSESDLKAFDKTAPLKKWTKVKSYYESVNKLLDDMDKELFNNAKKSTRE